MRYSLCLNLLDMYRASRNIANVLILENRLQADYYISFCTFKQIPVSSPVLVLPRRKCYLFGLLGHIIKFQFLVQLLFFLGGNVIGLGFWGI